jgi:hypothetical protein
VMGRPPMIPAEKKTRIVLAILAGEMSIAVAARRRRFPSSRFAGGRRSSSRPAGPRWWRVGLGRQAERSSWRPRSWS